MDNITLTITRDEADKLWSMIDELVFYDSGDDYILLIDPDTPNEREVHLFKDEIDVLRTIHSKLSK